MAIQAILKRTWIFLDHSIQKRDDSVEVKPGTYELERIPNPRGHEGYWFIIKGTTIGGGEKSWRQFIGCEGRFKITLTEDGVPMEPYDP
jgi:hypothetical protein